MIESNYYSLNNARMADEYTHRGWIMGILKDTPLDHPLGQAAENMRTSACKKTNIDLRGNIFPPESILY